ncbi:MAG TPA: hypothetical protein PKW33_15985 [Anaerolineaceae bacterium]|nr:hypothetical protein [Anaerolineaceae bacterium]HPN53097.1 hypothetical protein [Anaerolineaceae bacterium]
MAQGSKKRGRIFIYIALIILVGVVAVWAGITFVLPQLGLGGSVGPLVSNATPVVVATPTPPVTLVKVAFTSQEVKRGQTFSADNLILMDYPREAILDEKLFFNDLKTLEGKRANADLPAHVVLTSGMVADATEGSAAAFRIPPGYVAISIPLANRLSSISYAPQPGDYVNVIATMKFIDLDPDFQTILPNYTSTIKAPNPGGLDKDGNAVQAELAVTIDGAGNPAKVQGKIEIDPTLGEANPIYAVPSEAQRSRMVSQSFLQNIMVLQVGDFRLDGEPGPDLRPTPTPSPTPEGAAPNSLPPAAPPEPTAPDVITLVVSPQDAITLNYLVYSGAQLTLVLRSAGDMQITQTEAVTLQYLMDRYGVPLPTKLAYGFDKPEAKPFTDGFVLPDRYAIP